MKPTPTKALMEATETVLMAMAYVQTIEPVVKGYQRALLEKFRFKVSSPFRLHEPEMEYVLDPEHSYLLSEGDAEKYYDALEKAHREHGFDVPPRHCPLLTAESIEREAKFEMLRAAMYITNIDPEQIWNMDQYRKLVELTMRFVVPHLSKKEVLKRFDELQAQKSK